MTKYCKVYILQNISFFMNEYTVEGPFRVKFKALPGGKMLQPESFWNDRTISNLKKEKGVYVYSIKPSKSQVHIPFYVGQAKKSFEQEVFQSRNITKYDDALKNYQKAHPCLFFVIYPKKRGKTNIREVTEIEKYLTKEAKITNPKLMNKTNVKIPTWKIKGVIHCTKKKSKSANEFENMIFGKE